MANEAILVQRLQDRLPTCEVKGDVDITKGTVLKITLTETNRGAASAADGDLFLGIAAADYSTNDVPDTLTIWTKGIFLMKCDGVGVAAGDLVKIGGANLISVADDATAAGLSEVIGLCLEDGGAGDEVMVRLGL